MLARRASEGRCIPRLRVGLTCCRITHGHIAAAGCRLLLPDISPPTHAPPLRSRTVVHACAGPGQAGFPAALAPLWTGTIGPQQVEQERRFLVQDGTRFWSGSFARVVWLADGHQTMAADVLDFKTDALSPGDEPALSERAEFYRPQLDAYLHAIACLAALPPERIATRLEFTCAGCVRKIFPADRC